MKKTALTVLLLAPCFHAAWAQDVQTPAAAASAPAQEASAPVAEQPAPDSWQAMCLFGGVPPAGTKYKVVTKLREAKGTYGSARELVPKLVAEARSAGGQAVIHYSGAQRFGFWPWRLARPVVSGEVIQWEETPSQGCEALGGVTAGQLVATNVSPSR
jgi:hypothetical protein